MSGGDVTATQGGDTSPPTSSARAQSVPYTQLNQHLLATDDIVVLRNTAAWAEWQSAGGGAYIFSANDGNPSVTPPPCLVQGQMVVVFRLTDHHGCSPPTITVTDVSVVEDTLLVAYHFTSNEQLTASDDGTFLTCPAIWPVSFAVCVPPFDGPIESVLTGVDGPGMPLLIEQLAQQ